MPSIQKRSVRIFYSYAHKDKKLRDELAKYLGRSDIRDWYDRDILPGQDWENEIDTNLENADLILLLISVDFMNSNYCYGKEMRRALERNEQGEAVVIPVILRPASWQTPLFNRLQVLPRGMKPVVSRPDRDEAFLEVALGIRSRVNDVLKKGYLADAEVATNEGNYEDTCIAYYELIRLFPQDPSFRKELGDILFYLEHFEEALKVLKEAIHLDPENAQFYVSKGRILVRQKKFTEALADYQRAVELGISDFLVYKELGDIRHTLGAHYEALDAYEEAIRLSPRMPLLFVKRGDIHISLNNYEAAVRDYDRAIALSPGDAQFYVRKGDVLAARDYHGALSAYEEAIKLEPENAQLWRKKGQCLARLGQSLDAHAAYEKAIDYDPRNAYVYKEYADVLMKLNDAVGAMAAYDDAIRCQPDFALAYRGKGEALALMAQQSYDRLMKLSRIATAKAIELNMPHEGDRSR